MDLGDKHSCYCVLDSQGEVIYESKVSTSKKAIAKVFGSMGSRRVALEVGTHSPWVSRLLWALGHEVVVVHDEHWAARRFYGTASIPGTGIFLSPTIQRRFGDTTGADRPASLSLKSDTGLWEEFQFSNPERLQLFLQDWAKFVSSFGASVHR